MPRMRALAMVAALSLSLTACGGGAPDSYTLRPDLCEVLDYQAFTRWFGTMNPAGESIGNAKVSCTQHGMGFSNTNVTIRIEAFKYESPEEARKVFDRLIKNSKTTEDGNLKTEVDEVRYSKGTQIVVLDRDLFLTVNVSPEATDDSSFKDELPRLTVELTDQVLERLREKS